MEAKQITMDDIRNYLSRINNKTNLKQWKEVTIELRDEFNLSDFEAMNIMNGREYAILEVLKKKTSLAATR